MIYTNKSNLPAALAAAIANDPYSCGDSDITVTGLIAPPRQKALMATHADKLTEDVASCIFRLIGSSVHSILERSQSSELKEARLSTERNGWKISGAFDSFALSSGILADYKVTTLYAVKDGYKEEWEQQLNLLALLCREHWLPVKKLQIVAILRDWSMNGAKRNPDFPQQQVVTVDIPLWDDAKAEKYLIERVQAHQEARAGKLPLCSDTDRWKTSDVWAVMKTGNKRAKKLCKSDQEAGALAAELGDGHIVEFRKGECKRCPDYCSVSDYCEQWQAEKASQTETKE